MRLPRLRTVLLTPLILFAAFYVFFAVKFAVDDDSIAVIDGPLAPHDTIVLFGATGTAGDGILKAAMADPEIKKIRDHATYVAANRGRRAVGESSGDPAHGLSGLLFAP